MLFFLTFWAFGDSYPFRTTFVIVVLPRFDVASDDVLGGILGAFPKWTFWENCVLRHEEGFRPETAVPLQRHWVLGWARNWIIAKLNNYIICRS